MKNPYFFLYFCIYKICKLIKSNDIPEWSAVIILSILISLDSIVLIKWLNLDDILIGFSHNDGIFVGFILILFNYIIFIRNKNTLKSLIFTKVKLIVLSRPFF